MVNKDDYNGHVTFDHAVLPHDQSFLVEV